MRDLSEYVASENKALKNCEWCFCRLVENADEMFCFDESLQEMRKFILILSFGLSTKMGLKRANLALFLLFQRA